MCLDDNYTYRLMKFIRVCKIQVMHTFKESLLSTAFAPKDFLSHNKNFTASQELFESSFSKIITQAVCSSTLVFFLIKILKL